MKESPRNGSFGARLMVSGGCLPLRGSERMSVAPRRARARGGKGCGKLGVEKDGEGL